MRHIQDQLVNYIDAKLAPNGLAQHAIDTKDARLVFGLAMESLVGVHEVGGNNQGPMVELLQKTIGTAEREPWCMATVQSCLAYAEKKTGVQSPIYPTEHCMTCFRETPVTQRVKVQPLKYAIIIWNLEGTDSGHTGIILEVNKESYMRTLEGNTTGTGPDGIYYKKRDWIRDGNLLRKGFLKPF